MQYKKPEYQNDIKLICRKMAQNQCHWRINFKRKLLEITIIM